jgi:hypothetical protein
VIRRVDDVVGLAGQLERPAAQPRRPTPGPERRDQLARPQVLMDVNGPRLVTGMDVNSPRLVTGPRIADRRNDPTCP